MSDQLASAEDRLVAGLREAVRGPTRNGLFALWLFVRACDGLLPPDALSIRLHRRRLNGLERRLSSLSLHPPIRKALNGGLRELNEGTAGAAVAALQHLVAPAREALGSAVGDTMALAARTAKASARSRHSGA